MPESPLPERRSLWRRLLPLGSTDLLGLLAVLFLATILFGLLRISILRDEQLSLLKARGERTAALSADVLSRPMYDFDYELVATQVAALGNDPDTAWVQVTDAAGKEVAAVNLPAPPPDGPVIERRLGHDDGDKVVDLGRLRIGLSTLATERELVRTAWQGAMVLLTLFAVLAVAIAYSFRRLTRPIDELGTAILRLAGGDKNAVIPVQNREDELGDVARAVETFRRYAREAEALQEARAAELVAREGEARLKMIIEAMPVMLALLESESGQVQLANRLMRDRVLGARDEDLPQSSLNHFLSADDVLRVRDAGDTPAGQALEIQVNRLEGGSFPAMFAAKRIEFQDQEALLIGINDISDRKQAEAELQRSNAEFQQFSYAVSHDLQEPLRGVINFLTLLDRRHRKDLAEDAQEYIRYAVEGAKRMSDMIHDLLEFSRVQTQVSEPKLVESGDLVRVALANLSAAIDEAQAKVSVAANLPTVLGSRTQLTRVFQNLIGNAIKYRAPDRPPEIAVTVEDLQGKWVFSVADNGIGIDPAFHDRIFGVFQRLHTREEYGGTGIGLALVKRIVEQHGGRIWLESRPDEGCTFKFSLDKARAS